jgi:hypothetical protein
MSADSDFPVFTVLDREPSLFEDGVIFHAVKVDDDKWVQVAHNPTAPVGSEVIRVKPEWNTFAEIVDFGFGEYDAIENAVTKAMQTMGLVANED